MHHYCKYAGGLADIYVYAGEMQYPNHRNNFAQGCTGIQKMIKEMDQM